MRDKQEERKRMTQVEQITTNPKRCGPAGCVHSVFSASLCFHCVVLVLHYRGYSRPGLKHSSALRSRVPRVQRASRAAAAATRGHGSDFRD